MSQILIVDDKEENLYYLRALFTGHGHEVEIAHHGAEALFKARQAPPDLVVSDLLMPVMDGYTLLRHWKSDARLRDVPFIVYTATYTEAEDERLALSLGADAFILKPAEPEDFLARVRAVQGASQTAQPFPRADLGPPADETALLKSYSETLIRKLEDKQIQLEETNRALQRDIAERRRTEEQLRESEERFRATFEQAAVGIAHLGLDGSFLRANDTLCAMTGYTRDELLQRTLPDLAPAEDRAETDELRRALLAGTRAARPAERRHLRQDGTSFWAHLGLTLLRNPAGEPQHFIAVFTDTTERRTLQEQVFRAQRLESIGTLAGGIAHDLNNLLTPVLMSLPLLRDAHRDAGTASMLDIIENSALRASDLVRQVLSFARGVSGVRTEVDLSRVAAEIEAIARNTFPKDIEFQCSVPAGTWRVPGDSTQINQVLLNLCLNARDAMPAGGRLILAARNLVVDETYAAMHRAVEPGRYVLVEVTDTGTGMPPEVVERIFDPFFTTKEPGKGTGLGLSTAQGIVRSHGGCIQVRSTPGAGTTFSVHLPALGTAAGSDGAETIDEERLRGRGELVLIVDDETSILTITRHTLEKFGYRTLVAEDGAIAVGLYAQHAREIAAVITDMMMPVMDGPALVAALQRINPAVRLVGTSGLHDDPRTARAIAAGVKHHLQKPCTVAAILETLRAALDGAAPRAT